MTRWASLASAVFYGTTSLAMTFWNKKLLGDFPYPNVVMLGQNLLSVALLLLLASRGWLEITLSRKAALRMQKVGIAYSVHVALALGALTRLNVPIYGVLKRLTALVVLVIQYVVYGRAPSHPRMPLAVLLVSAGALIAGASDLQFTLLGYSLAMSSCCAQAAYMLLVAQVSSHVHTHERVFYNAAWSLLPSLVLALSLGELRAAASYPWSVRFGFVFLGTTVLGFVLNFSVFLCVSRCDALTTSITGNVKATLSTLLGFFAFGVLETNATNLLGIVLNSVGGIYYSYLKFIGKHAKEPTSSSSTEMNKV